MRIHLLTRRRTVLDQEVQEPTLFALALVISGIAILLAVCVVAIAGVPAFGSIGWAFAAVAAFLMFLLLGLRRQPGPLSPSTTGRQRWFRGILGGARML